MRTTFATFLMSCTLGGGSVGADARDDVPAVAPPPRPPKIERVHQTHDGSVTAIGKTFVTVSVPGGTTYKGVWLPNGEWATVPDKIIPEQPPQRFEANKTLAAGGFKPTVCMFTYRLSDVKVGDTVAVEYSVIDNVHYCDAICIKKRPGGEVPPAPGDNPKNSPMYHEYLNKAQRLLDRMATFQAVTGTALAVPDSFNAVKLLGNSPRHPGYAGR